MELMFFPVLKFTGELFSAPEEMVVALLGKTAVQISCVGSPSLNSLNYRAVAVQHESGGQEHSGLMTL